MGKVFSIHATKFKRPLKAGFSLHRHSKRVMQYLLVINITFMRLNLIRKEELHKSSGLIGFKKSRALFGFYLLYSLIGIVG